MVVIIPHSAQELEFTHLQKDLISRLNDENTIWYRKLPMWIELSGVNLVTKEDLKNFSKTIEAVEIEDMQISSSNIQFFLPITVKTKNGSISTTLPLVQKFENDAGECGMRNEEFGICKSKFPTIPNSSFLIPHYLNIFRLGIVTESENSQFSILNSPLSSHNLGTTIQSSKTCSYVLQDSVWFKKSK